jgi:ATP-binding cassette, subfamily B, bacterial
VTALIDWQLAVIALAISPIIFLLSRIHCRHVRSRWDRSRELEGATMSVVQEVLSVLRGVKGVRPRAAGDGALVAPSHRRQHADSAINGGFDKRSAQSAPRPGSRSIGRC